MENKIEQAFKINFLKIGTMTNTGVLQIGVGAGITQKGAPAGYTTIGESLVHVTAPTAPAVPLQAAVRDFAEGL
ncbi:spore germination protein GerPB [Neobacillus rhizosphaerae]|uniref:spore germination protein GerPB n=1 Tax=Neobacillus rhizosphaerae TaxID=2880965 RepID=UPI003D298E4C